MNLNKNYIKKKIQFNSFKEIVPGKNSGGWDYYYNRSGIAFGDTASSIPIGGFNKATPPKQYASRPVTVTAIEEHAYYIDIMLTKTFEIFDYVDVKKDEREYIIPRQEINPYYLEFDFFGTAKRIKVNNKEQLTSEMMSYIYKNIAEEEVIATFSLTNVEIYTDAYVRHYYSTNHFYPPYYNKIGFTIQGADRRVSLPSSKKFKITGSAYYDGIYMLKNFNEARGRSSFEDASIWRDSTGSVGEFFLSPTKTIKNPTTNGAWLQSTLPSTAKLLVIKDNFGSSYEEVYEDANWDVKSWFERVGRNQLLLTETVTVDDYTQEKTTVNDLEKLEYIMKTPLSVISKAYYFPIKVNK